MVISFLTERAVQWRLCSHFLVLMLFYFSIWAIHYSPMRLHCSASLTTCQTSDFTADVSFLFSERFVSTNLRRATLSCQADSEHFALNPNHLMDNGFQTYVPVPHKKHQFFNYLCWNHSKSIFAIFWWKGYWAIKTSAVWRTQKILRLTVRCFVFFYGSTCFYYT